MVLHRLVNAQSKKPEYTIEKETLADGKLDSKPSKYMMKGFETASGKSVSVSENCLEKVKGLLTKTWVDFNETSLGIENGSILMNDDMNAAKPSFKGFLTASGKVVPIDETALQKARTLLDSYTASSEDVESIGLKDAGPSVESAAHSELYSTKHLVKDKIKENFGFCTASGKAVSVSREALTRAKSLMDGIEDGNIISDKGSTAVITNGPNKKTICEGFSTASGKSVTINIEALTKAKALLHDTEVELLKMKDINSIKSFSQEQSVAKTFLPSLQPFEKAVNVHPVNLEEVKSCDASKVMKNLSVEVHCISRCGVFS